MPLRMPAVHPRACGEHVSTDRMSVHTFGSSPRMRGTRGRQRRGIRPARFIPAHAGNTKKFSYSYPWLPVHPRACGEHRSWTVSRLMYSGSSPRMRGTPLICAHGVNDKRFIPAHAGNTATRGEGVDTSAVHPRACGEHAYQGCFPSSNFGSSPRMRGTRNNVPFTIPPRRFIPAHAGNTRSHSLINIPVSVHPRACGEHRPCKAKDGRKSGSSPRMRGTRRAARHRSLRHRFIPAHAGNTCRPPGGLYRSPVHPRACGEHYSSARFCCV